MSDGLVVAVFGPTGVGKSSVAVAIAEAYGSRIVSCDSMQLYRGFPVLTNRPDAAEEARAHHELVGILDAEEEWSAAQYARRARPLIDEDAAGESPGMAFLVGGTGLYMRAALAPLEMRSKGDPELRSRLEARAAADGGDVLHAELAALDPAAAERIHPHNVRRTVRALEVALCEGRGAWSGRDDLWRPSYRLPTLLIGLTLDREVLYERINRRARDMCETGAVDEVGRFLESRPSGETAGVARGASVAGSAAPRESDAPAAAPRAPSEGIRRAIGFREIEAYLEARSTLDEAVERLAQATRAYARRQITWMRKLSDAVIIDASRRDTAGVAGEILDLLRGGRGIQQVGRPG